MMSKTVLVGFAVVAAQPLQVFDTHFHQWDTTSDDTGHDSTVADYAEKFVAADYVAAMSGLPSGMELAGGAWMEAMSVCYAGISGSAFSEHCMKELNFVNGEPELGEFLLLPSAALEQEDAPQVLREMAQNPRVRGIRQIMNYEPSFPRNEFLGELLDSKAWQQGFRELERNNLNFDLQLNPSQFMKAAKTLYQLPSIPVIIDHLGTPTLEDLTEKSAQYWSGLAALAKLPNTYIKLSYLAAIDPKWNENAVVIDAVHRVIKLFGVHRCFFASNYPVERAAGWEIGDLYMAFKKLAERYSDSEQRGLFADNAKRAYMRQSSNISSSVLV